MISFYCLIWINKPNLPANLQDGKRELQLENNIESLDSVIDLFVLFHF